jgi:hypothetical protein
MLSADRIVDLVRDPAVSRDDAIAMIRQYAERAAMMATDLVWHEVHLALELSKKIAARETTP